MARTYGPVETVPGSATLSPPDQAEGGQGGRSLVRTIRWAPHPSAPVNSRRWGRERGESERFRGLSCLTVAGPHGPRGRAFAANHRHKSCPGRRLHRPSGNPWPAPSRRRFSPLANSNEDVAPHAPPELATSRSTAVFASASAATGSGRGSRSLALDSDGRVDTSLCPVPPGARQL